MSPDGPEERQHYFDECSYLAQEDLDLDEQLADESRDDLRDVLIEIMTPVSL